jgi:hypothetical protein
MDRSFSGTLPVRTRHPVAAMLIALAIGVAALVMQLNGLAAALWTAPTPAATVTSAQTDYRAADLAALASLKADYLPQLGAWSTSSWWNGAVALTNLVDAERATGDRSYADEIAQVYAIGWWNNPGFVRHYYDDSGWWGIAWLDAYQLTGNRDYLATAEGVAAFMSQGWTSACGGGVQWTAEPSGKNSITTALYLELNAELGQVTGRATYTHRAETAWSWMAGSPLLRQDGLLADTLTAQCWRLGTGYSYATGTVLAGLAALAQSTGNPAYATAALRLGTAYGVSALTSPGGIATDAWDPSTNPLGDRASFKAALPRGMARADAVLPGAPFTAYLAHNAVTVYASDRAVGDRYGINWAGPITDVTSYAQVSAIALLTTQVQQHTN